MCRATRQVDEFLHALGISVQTQDLDAVLADRGELELVEGHFEAVRRQLGKSPQLATTNQFPLQILHFARLRRRSLLRNRLLHGGLELAALRLLIPSVDTRLLVRRAALTVGCRHGRCLRTSFHPWYRLNKHELVEGEQLE